MSEASEKLTAAQKRLRKAKVEPTEYVVLQLVSMEARLVEGDGVSTLMARSET